MQCSIANAVKQRMCRLEPDLFSSYSNTFSSWVSGSSFPSYPTVGRRVQWNCFAFCWCSWICGYHHWSIGHQKSWQGKLSFWVALGESSRLDFPSQTLSLFLSTSAGCTSHGMLAWCHAHSWWSSCSTQCGTHIWSLALHTSYKWDWPDPSSSWRHHHPDAPPSARDLPCCPAV